MPEDRTAHKVHQWSFSIRRSWVNTMLKQINELDLQYMLAPVPNKIFCLKQAREKLNQIDRQHWEDSLLCNGRDESNQIWQSKTLFLAFLKVRSSIVSTFFLSFLHIT